MGRTLGLLGIGIAIGAAATYFALADRGSPLTPIVESAFLRAGSLTFSNRLLRVTRAPNAARHSSRRRGACGVLSASRGGRRYEPEAPDARRRGAAEASPGRTFALDALLARYVEIDAADAVEAGRELKLDATLLAAPYRSLAEADPRAALSALSRVDDPLQAQAIGLALLPAFGNDTRAAERIAASMASSVDREQFLVGAIGTRAQAHPAEALRDAIALTDAGQRFAAMQSVMSTGPGKTLRPPWPARRLDAMLKMQLQGTALSVWGMSDPEAMLEYVTKLEPQAQRQMMLQGLQQIAAANPRRAFELADRLPPEQSGFIRQVALGSDGRPGSTRGARARGQHAARATAPAGVSADRASLRPKGCGRGLGVGSQHAAAATRIAQHGVHGHRATGPDARFRSCDDDRIASRADASPPIGREVPGDARRRRLESDRGQDHDACRQLQSTLDVADGGVELGHAKPESGDRVAAHPRRASRRGRFSVDRLTLRTTRSRRRSRIPRSCAGRGARGLDDDGCDRLFADRSRRGPELDQAVPGPGRVRSCGRCDRFKRSAIQPACCRRAAWPRSILRAPDVTSAMVNVANQWATTDPYAAADWALEFDDAASRSNALTGIAQAWGSYDPRAARSWALSLPSGAKPRLGPARCGVLIGATESVDQALLGAFSNERMRQQGVMRADSSGCAARFRRGAPHDRGLHQRSGHCAGRPSRCSDWHEHRTTGA